MNNIFFDFIESDPRKSRTRPYNVNLEFMELRHNAVFRNILLEGKTILDLGSCVGYTGAYVLEKGAKKYYGVEYSPELYDISKNNFQKHYSADKWDVINTSIEKFLETNLEKFDIIISMGSIYAVKEPVAFLEKISRIAKTIIIESAHPSLSNKYKSLLEETFIEEFPFIVYSKQKMIHENSMTDLEYIGAKPSLGLVKLILKENGFKCSNSEYEELKTNLNDIYKAEDLRRYLVVANKLKNIQSSIGYVPSAESGNFTTSPIK